MVVVCFRGARWFAALIALLSGEAVWARSVWDAPQDVAVSITDRTLNAPLDDKRCVIDWTSRSLRAHGHARGTIGAYLPPTDEPFAQRRAESMAQGRLIGLLNTLLLGHGTPSLQKNHAALPQTLTEAVAQNTRLAPIIWECVQRMQVTRVSYSGDGSIDLDVALSLDGFDVGLASLWSAMVEGQAVAGAKAADTAAQSSTAEPQRAEILATGIVVNAHGLGFVPSLWPRIISVDGDRVYGVGSVNKDILMLRGLMGVTRSLDVALAHSRVAPLPHVITALRVLDGDPHTLVVSRSDAALLVASSDAVLEARVMVVVD